MNRTPVSQELKTVGVVGAGRMGTPIIGHLARRRFATRVFDRDSARAEAAEKLGAKWAGSAAALAAECDAILVCVGFDREVRELLAEGGPVRKARRGAVIAILSTIHPKTVQSLAREAGGAGLDVVDSTVCRGGEAADSGTLLSFVGGSAEVVGRLTPVLRAYSSDVVHTGGVGTAQVAKAANNLILWACLVADHEGLALAQHYGVDMEALRRALLISSCANGPLEKWGTQTMAWAEDDMAIVAEMAAEAGIALPQAGVNREICRVLKPIRYQLDRYGR
ncbi:MAG TPA: NAD(P)-dependent oxidoreductase [Burkholderiales bacterium]|nr:NAD(P)-dependent oxidoreductase [Burkholderiales bacterium]